MELIVLPVTPVFWVWYEQRADSTAVFRSCWEIKDFFQFLCFSRGARVRGLGGAQQAGSQAGPRTRSMP